MAHAVTPVAFLPVVGYLWLVGNLVLFFAHFKSDKPILLVVGYGV